MIIKREESDKINLIYLKGNLDIKIGGKVRGKF